MANATESALGKTMVSVTGIVGAYTLGEAIRLKSVIVTGTVDDIIVLRENILGNTTDPAIYLTLPYTSAGFIWNTGEYYVTPRIDYAASTVADWSKVKITFMLGL
jgi:hypothetical protein